MKPNVLIIIFSVFLISCSSLSKVDKKYNLEQFSVNPINSRKSTLFDHSNERIKGDSCILFGHIIDNYDFSPLIGSTIIARNFDTDSIIGTVANSNGNFILFPNPGKYELTISSIGYDNLQIVEIECRKGEINKILIGLKYNGKFPIINTGKTAHNSDGMFYCLRPKPAHPDGVMFFESSLYYDLIC